MDGLIKGLHHVTSMAKDAKTNNRFFTEALGLRRVKKTVNFDEPSVYHLYYGDGAGTPGSVMTYFPFPNMRKARSGAGEVAVTQFSVPIGANDYWRARFIDQNIEIIDQSEAFGASRLTFAGPDGEHFAMIEADDDARAPWTGTIEGDLAIRGFHSAAIRVQDKAAMTELLQFMGYSVDDTQGAITRLSIQGNAANIIELVEEPNAQRAQQGAGSVHHIAFAVENRAAQLSVRKALMDTGYQVTPVIDRDYFWAIYFRTPDGVLFEIATNEPGFDRDEPMEHLGESLKLPNQHEHLRDVLQNYLPAL